METTGCCLILHKLDKLMFASFLMSAKWICNKWFLDFSATSSLMKLWLVFIALCKKKQLHPPDKRNVTLGLECRPFQLEQVFFFTTHRTFPREGHDCEALWHEVSKANKERGEHSKSNFTGNILKTQMLRSEHKEQNKEHTHTHKGRWRAGACCLKHWGIFNKKQVKTWGYTLKEERKENNASRKCEAKN